MCISGSCEECIIERKWDYIKLLIIEAYGHSSCYLENDCKADLKRNLLVEKEFRHTRTLEDLAARKIRDILFAKKWIDRLLTSSNHSRYRELTNELNLLCHSDTEDIKRLVRVKNCELL